MAAAREVQVKGPSVAVALDPQGQPTMALRKWAEKQGAALDALTRATDGKQECFYYRSVLPGVSPAAAIQDVIQEALAALPILKLMSYQLADSDEARDTVQKFTTGGCNARSPEQATW